MADITYCGHHECTSKECMRHYTHAPTNRVVSWAMFDCPYIPLGFFDGYEEVIHAHWIYDCEPYHICSNCRHKFSLFDRVPRCPNCGAHMDKELFE